MSRPLFVGKARKYRNTPWSYGGVEYHSKAEANHAATLDIRIKAGEVHHWDRQVRVPLKVNGLLICTYVVDFVVYHTDGGVTYEEVRGMDRPDATIKLALFKALFPERVLRIIR